jgi:hypothetical protein
LVFVEECLLPLGFGGHAEPLTGFHTRSFRTSDRRLAHKSGGPPLLEPSFKVQRDRTHNQNSGVVAPGLKGFNALGPSKVHSRKRCGVTSQTERLRGLISVSTLTSDCTARLYLHWDDNLGRRSITNALSSEEAERRAKKLARTEQEKIGWIELNKSGRS